MIETRKCIIIYEYTYFLDGDEVSRKTFELIFENNRYIEGQSLSYRLYSKRSIKENQCGYIELDVKSKDGSRVFKAMSPFPQYEIFSNIGKKSFFSSFTNKTSDPQIIGQIELFKRFVITYPAINIDLKKDFSTAFLFINPYEKPIIIVLKTQDLKTIDRKKILPREAVYFPLSCLLSKGENSWKGQIHMTANNRIVAVVLNHKKDDMDSISNMEHLDPFRSDSTHQRFSQKIRSALRNIFSKK